MVVDDKRHGESDKIAYYSVTGQICNGICIALGVLFVAWNISPKGMQCLITL